MEIPSLTEYYVQHVFPLDRRFRRWSPKESSTVVCPIHEDTDPSMGFIMTREGEKFHCFGCGAAGTLPELHRSVLRVHHGRFLDKEEARRDLYKIYGVEEEDIPEENSWTRRLQREKNIDSARGQMGVNDLRVGIRQCRGRGQLDALLTRYVIADNFAQQELLGAEGGSVNKEDSLGVS